MIYKMNSDLYMSDACRTENYLEFVLAKRNKEARE